MKTDALDIDAIRADFPVLQRQVANRPLVYFDNAATALKPRHVIDAELDYLSRSSANIHRGRHLLSEEASEAYEGARDKVARFFNARRTEVIFLRGATEGVNVVAGGLSLGTDDNVLGTILEHHSNILPWRSRCTYRAAPLTLDGLPDLARAAALVDERTRLVAITASSNVTGVEVPVRAWVEFAHERGLPILVDAAQAAAHRPLDFKALGCDFMVVSGHKMCGPTGIGALIGKEASLERLWPVPLGGGSVSLVRPDFSYELRDLPWRMEAGTPNIAGAIGFGAAVEFLSGLGMERIERRNRRLGALLDEALSTFAPCLSFLQPAPAVPRACLVSMFDREARVLPDYLSRVLSDSFGVMLRGGHHCAHPLHDAFGVAGSLRLSLQFYNTEEEILHTRDALEQALAMFGITPALSRSP